ncbi:MAG: hypothetical protein R3E31_01065 [Chloroflexota bacterium]
MQLSNPANYSEENTAVSTTARRQLDAKERFPDIFRPDEKGYGLALGHGWV